MKFWRMPKHLEILNGEVGELCERVARLEADMKWVKLLVICIFTGVIGLLIQAYLLP